MCSGEQNNTYHTIFRHLMVVYRFSSCHIKKNEQRYFENFCSIFRPNIFRKSH